MAFELEATTPYNMYQITINISFIINYAILFLKKKRTHRHGNYEQSNIETNFQ